MQYSDLPRTEPMRTSSSDGWFWELPIPKGKGHDSRSKKRRTTDRRKCRKLKGR